VIRYAVYFALLYLGFTAFLYLFQRQMVFMPPAMPGGPAEYGLAEMQEVYITTADGLSLKSWFQAPRDTTKPIIVHFHGNASSLGGRAYGATEQFKGGYGVLLVGYRGYSGNPGQPTEAGLYQDATANLAWLEKQGYSQYVLQGESLGTGIAVEMAAKGRGRALILESPYTSLVYAAAWHYPFVPVRWLMHDRFDSISKISKVKIPLLIIMGEADRTIPVTQGKQLFAAANDPKQAVWIAGADHVELYQHGAAAIVLEFLAKTFP
jgi:fermentation-respiration switch protein FrsA (DUF1100 family)